MHNKGRLVDEDEVSVMECALVIALSLIAVIIAVKVVKARKRRGRQRLKEELRVSYREEYTKRFLPLNRKLQRMTEVPESLAKIFEKIGALDRQFARLLDEEQLEAADSTLNEITLLFNDAEKAFNSSNEATPH